MGKIMVEGKSERSFKADRCCVELEIVVSGGTAGGASSLSSEECENLLSKLVSLGITPNTIKIRDDKIERKTSYRSEEGGYESRKTLSVVIPANMQLINSIRGVIEDGFDYVSFDTRYFLSNESELTKQLLKDAIVDSRAKAELLAESMGLRIIGVDTANLSGYGDVYDLTEDIDDFCVYGMAHEERYLRVLSDQLNPEEVDLTAEVKIVWIAG